MARVNGTLTGTGFAPSATKVGRTLQVLGGVQHAPDAPGSGTSFSLTATAGSVAITGDAALLKRGLGFIASAGSITITGDAATLVTTRSVVLSLDAGIVTITGAPATLSVPSTGLTLTPIVGETLILTPDSAGSLTLTPSTEGTLTLTPITPH